jgi:polyhydroxyalkanoate synthesis regulator phasin
MTDRELLETILRQQTETADRVDALISDVRSVLLLAHEVANTRDRVSLLERRVAEIEDSAHNTGNGAAE